MGDLPLRTPKHHRHGRPLPYHPANATHAHLIPIKYLINSRCLKSIPCGVSHPFEWLSPCMRQVAYALRTRPPVATYCIATIVLPLDLHVLSLPLAFILSQDQTLHCIILSSLILNSVILPVNTPQHQLSYVRYLGFIFIKDLFPQNKKLISPLLFSTPPSSTLGLQKYSLYIYQPKDLILFFTPKTSTS